jgi:hypothetical protein
MRPRNESPKLAETHPRLTGVILLLFAAAVLYFMLVVPIQGAAPGETIRVSRIALAIGIISAELGLLLVALGAYPLKLLTAASEGSPTGARVVGVLLALSVFIVMALLKSYLRTHGYIE